MNYPVKGSCQCGKINYEITEPFLYQVVCHCTDCQKLSATSFSISSILPQDAFKLLSGTLKKWSRIADSGKQVDCYFCPECGNRIYHHSPDKPEYIRLKPGTLEDTAVINPQAHAWVKRKQAWVEIPKGVQQYDTQPEW